MTTTTSAFWLDWDYDRNNADTGTRSRSRYGDYLRRHAKTFADIWYDDPSTEVAATAWRIATGPIMVPPLVRSHPRITAATLIRSGWDGEIAADVRLISHRPRPLLGAKTADGDPWLDQRPDGASGCFDGIDEEDLTREAYLLTEVRLLWQLPTGTLPRIREVPTDGDALFRHAVECVTQLVAALNREVDPVIGRLS